MQLDKITGIISGNSIDWFNPNNGRILGEGTYGEVKRYRNKVVKISKNVYYGTSASLLREAAFLCKLSHPNIIKLLDVFILPNKFCLVLPEAKMDLLDRRKISPRLTEEEVKIIAYQLIRGVAYLHSQDILHGDLKPSNILYFEEIVNDKPCIRISIADFGLAQPNQCYKVIEQREVFTIWYRPPEILLGGNYTAVGDIWATGLIIHEIFTNSTLFPGADETIVLARQFGKFGIPTEQTWPGVSLLPYYDTIPEPLFMQPSLSTGVRKFDLLMSKMLKLNPKERSDSVELLDNVWFDNIRQKLNSDCLRAPEINSINCNVSILDNSVVLTSRNPYPLDLKQRYSVLKLLYRDLQEDFVSR